LFEPFQNVLFHNKNISRTFGGSEKTFRAECGKIFRNRGRPNGNTSRVSGRVRSVDMRAEIELTNLVLNIQIGSYTESDVVPDKYILDLILTIDPGLVLID
tara:strand:- start:149 stop:451 length:303 start_codon:yes stop_codon:yes gene_type:complete